MSGLNNWLDSAEVSPGYPVEAFDSLFYNLFDDFQLSFLGTPSGGSGADQLVLSDGATVQLSGAASFGDSLSFADSFNSQLLSNNSFGDQMFMSDLFGLQLNIGLIFSDTGSMGDGSSTATNDQLLVTASDDLNAWLDAFDSLSSTSETTYLRQYLNDVIN
jgi:hypothetical protein